jgi:predicted dehydrogenase
MGGGALLEGGVHWLNTLSSLSGGVPAEVIAARAEVTYPSNIPLEDSVLLVVRFSNGVVGRLLHSWKIPNRFFGLGLSKIYGTKGVITFESNGLFFSMFGTRKKKKVMSPFEFLGFRAMHRAFVEAWVNNRSWVPTLERIGQELRAVKAAYRSLKTHRFEEI